MNESITVYSKPGCVQCTATLRRLEQAGLDFTVIDVSQDLVALEYVTGLGHVQAPVVETRGARWSGYRPDLIHALSVRVSFTERAAAAATVEPQ